MPLFYFSVALVLVLVGLSFFRERPSPLNLFGIVVCVVGLIMVNQK
jgi:drug/metabolite transporter (DMT)-like permease